MVGLCYTDTMEIDPHTLQQILVRIEKQMRCPQCGKNVPVDFSSVRVVADSAMLLQLKCDQCNAYIVLHASLHGVENLSAHPYDEDDTANVSTTMQLSEKEMAMLKHGLQEFDGSFEAMFKKYHDGTQPA
jgi:transcription elongation factor Elf1